MFNNPEESQEKRTKTTRNKRSNRKQIIKWQTLALTNQ